MRTWTIMYTVPVLQASVMQRSHRACTANPSYFQRTRADSASFAPGKLAGCSVTAATRSSAVTAPWTAKCYICSILIPFKDSKAEEKCSADVRLGGFVCGGLSIRGGLLSKPHWSNGWSESYPPSMWTISIKRTWASTMSHIHTTTFPWSPLCVQVLFFYYSAITSVFNVRSRLFIRSTRNGPSESSTCFSKNAVRPLPKQMYR